MGSLILSSLYFIAPTYLANMFPVFFTKAGLPLGMPVSEKYFGKNKSYRGFYAGYLGALLILIIQKYLYNKGIGVEISLLDYSQINIWLYAFLFGIGAITGDVIESFFKRRIGVKSGAPWVPFDQLDFIVGALIFLMPFYILPWQNILVILLFTPLLHFLSNLTGYALGIKKVWW